MDANRQKVIDKAKKLLELSRRGVDGEQQNAKVLLEKHMKKHNLTLNEIESGYKANQIKIDASDLMEKIFNFYMSNYFRR